MLVPSCKMIRANGTCTAALGSSGEVLVTVSAPGTVRVQVPGSKAMAATCYTFGELGPRPIREAADGGFDLHVSVVPPKPITCYLR